MRQYAGFGTAAETNQRYQYLLAQGQTGLSMAFDLPTQIGYDSDDPLALGEVGRVGVAISSLADMEQVFKGIPLDKVSTSMTINATAPILLALYLVVANKQGVPWSKLTGTVQNDILKEYSRARHVHLSTHTVAAPGRRHRRVLREGSAGLEHDQRRRLPHARGGLHGGAGDCVHTRRRDRLRADVRRARAGGGQLRAAHRLFLQLPQQFFRGGRQVPRRAAALGPHPARKIRREKRTFDDAAVPHADRRFDAHGAAAGQQHRPHDPGGARGGPGGHAEPAHQRERRGQRDPDRRVGAARVAHPANHRARVGRDR